jgi:hypothetical protein
MPEFDKISEYIDELALRKQTDFLLSEFKKIEAGAAEVAKAFKAFQIKVESGAGLKDLIDSQIKLNKETASYGKALKDTAAAQIQAEKLSQQLAKTKAEEAKASAELAKQQLAEQKAKDANTKATNAASKESEKAAAAAKKHAEAAAKAAEPYNKLVAQFTAAAKEAKNLGAQYGVNSKQAQAAAKEALELNNKLKNIDASIGNHQREVGNYGKALDGVKDKFRELGTFILGFIGITAGIEFFKGSVDAFLELDKSVRLLQNTLRNVGVPQLFGRIEESTKSLMKQFQFLDEADITTVFNKLVVYGKLTENQINDLLPVIIDFATATGQTLPEATATVIKGLEGNGRALKEFGINMKDAKSVTEGFDLVMRELKPRVEGVGKAFGESAAGGIATSKEQFKQLKEEVGQGLVPVLATLLGWLDKLLTGFGYLKKNLGNFFSDVGDLFGGDFNVLIGKGEGMAKRLEILNKRIESEASKGILEEALAGKSAGEAIGELNERLADRIKLLGRQQKNASGIFNADDIKTSEKAIRVLRGALDELFKSQADNKDKVLGIGDPKKDRTPGSNKDQLSDLARNQEAIRKALLEAARKQLQDKIEADKEIIADETKTYDERFKAAQDFYNDSFSLSQLERNSAFDDADAKAKEDKRKAALEITDKTVLAKTLQAIDEKTAAQKKQADANYNADILKGERENEKQIKDLRTKQGADAIAHNKSIHEQELQNIQIGYDEALLALDRKHLKDQQRYRGNADKIREIDSEYNRKKLLLEINKNVALLKADIDFTKETIALAEARAKASGKQEDIDAIAKAKQDLAALELKLQKDVNDGLGKIQKSAEEKRLESLEKLGKKIREIGNTAQQVFGVIQELVGVTVDRRKNEIQDQIDALDKQKEKDIEVANQSITNTQQRANVIAVIEATAQVKKEALERRQRQLDTERARFEKAARIASIIQETSLAVIHQLASGDPYTALGRAIAVGALGAIKLAIAIATPIPRFKHGLNKDYEGFGYVGDGGKSEAIERADGSVEITPDTDTLTYIGKGDRIHSDAHEYMKSYKHAALDNVKRTALNSAKSPEVKIPAENMLMLAKQDETNRLLKKVVSKKELHLHSSEGGMTAMWKHGMNSNKYSNEQTNW